METEKTTITINSETRKLLQLRKQENNLKNVDEVILQALNLSGSKVVNPKTTKEEVKKK